MSTHHAPIAYVVVGTRDFSGAAIRSVHASVEEANAARGTGLACPIFCRSDRRPYVGAFCRLALAMGTGWEAWLPA